MGLETQLTQRVLDILRRQCMAAGKKVYTFTMGKINEAKLSNFGEARRILPDAHFGARSCCNCALNCFPGVVDGRWTCTA
jgi:hypothetical protein